MKRTLLALLAFVMLLCLCSCEEKTPVREEAAPEAREESVNPIPATDQTPEPMILSENFLSDNGSIQVCLQADMESFPDAMPILRGKPKSITIQMVQQVAQAAFGDASLFEYSEELNRTEISEIVAALEYGVTDEAIYESYGENIDSYVLESVRQARLDLLDYYRNAYAKANELVEPAPCQWKFWPMEHYVFHDYDGTDPSYTDEIPYGVSADLRVTTTVNGIPYQIWANNNENSDFLNHSIRIFVNEPIDMGGTGSEEMARWVDALGVYSAKPATEQELESCVREAEQLLDKMGLGDWQLQAESKEDPFYEGKWMIEIEGQPVHVGFPTMKLNKMALFTDDTFSAQEYAYESVKIDFKNDGSLIRFDYEGPTEIVETVKESAQLSDQVKEAAMETLHSLQYADLFSYSEENGMDMLGPVEIESCQVSINTVQLGTVRQRQNDGDYLLIPAVIFKGEVEVIGKPLGAEMKSINLMFGDYAGEHTLLIVNLLDGTLI